MLFYEIKLINPDTSEVYYQVIQEKPLLPSQDVFNQFKGALLVITTKSHQLETIRSALTTPPPKAA